MEKRKIYGTIIGVLLFVLLILGITYAYFYWSSTDAQKTNVNLTVTKGLEGAIVYNPGTSILETADKSLESTDSYADSDVNATIEFWKTGNQNICGQLYLNILKMLSASGSSDANIGKTDTIKWAVTTYNVNNATEVLLQEGTFNGRRQGDKFAVTDNVQLNDFQTFYKIYLWMDAGAFDGTKSVVNELLSVEISASASDVCGHYGIRPEETLALLGLDDEVKFTTPNFSAISTSSDTGLYKSEDDLGTSYYFRGNPENNHVYFAGMDWRIVRINGDGSIRMISVPVVDNYYYNPASPVSNIYVGYMRGNNLNANSYDGTHANTVNSAIKNRVDNWYSSYILNTRYSGYVADTIYCNDRSLYTGQGYSSAPTKYAAYNRLSTKRNLTLKCVNVNDRFTVSSSLGNQDLTYPVGLVTADEVAMAGGVYGTENRDFYLRGSTRYWTMTPYEVVRDSSTGGTDCPPGQACGSGSSGGSGSSSSQGGVYMVLVDVTGRIAAFPATTNYGVRPVISIKGDAIVEGTGTSSDPFMIYQMGDVNRDGVLNEEDTNLALNLAVANIPIEDDEQFFLMDMNGDGTINTIDAMLVSQAVQGLL